MIIKKTDKHSTAWKTRMRLCKRCNNFYDSYTKRGRYCERCKFPNRKKKMQQEGYNEK